MLFRFLEPPFLFPWWNLWHKAKVPKVMGVVVLRTLSLLEASFFPSSVYGAHLGLWPRTLPSCLLKRLWFLVCRALLLALCFRCFYYNKNDYHMVIKPSSWWCPPSLNLTAPQQRHLPPCCAPSWSFTPSILLFCDPNHHLQPRWSHGCAERAVGSSVDGGILCWYLRRSLALEREWRPQLVCTTAVASFLAVHSSMEVRMMRKNEELSPGHRERQRDEGW
jgi:hypothetical protein